MNDLCLVLLGNYYNTFLNKSSFYAASPSYLYIYMSSTYQRFSFFSSCKDFINIKKRLFSGEVKDSVIFPFLFLVHKLHKPIHPPSKDQIYPKPLSTFANPPIHPFLDVPPHPPFPPPYPPRTHWLQVLVEGAAKPRPILMLGN